MTNTMNSNSRIARHSDTPPICFIAQNKHDLEQVYRLRYTCYRRKGSIDANPEEQFSDRFDATPNSFSFLVSSSTAALATVRISVVRPDCGWTDSPVQQVYGDHPAFQSISRESFVEASRLCFDRQARRDSFVNLVGNMAALASVYNVGWLVACPRVEHAPAYQRMFGFKALAAPRRYFGVTFETQLLGIRREDLEAYVQANKTMTSAWSEAVMRFSRSPAMQAAS
jgi:hypothetical protein